MMSFFNTIGRHIGNWVYKNFFRLVTPKFILEMQERSSKWRKVRNEHLKQHPTCAACGRSKDLAVHHVIPVSFDPNKELDPNNLLTLCQSPCHIVFGHLMNYKCYNPEVRQFCSSYRTLMSRKRKCLS